MNVNNDAMGLRISKTVTNKNTTDEGVERVSNAQFEARPED